MATTPDKSKTKAKKAVKKTVPYERQIEDAPTSAFNIRNRIIELVYLSSKQLMQNPNNWRLHPKFQRQVLTGVIKDIGIADALIVYESERYGGITIIDGHMRADEFPEQEWPCLKTDLSDTEADYYLMVKDPLTGLFEADRDAYQRLQAVDRETDDQVRTFLLEQEVRILGDPPPTPSLADLKDRYDEHTDDAFWPRLQLKLAPPVYARLRLYFAALGEDLTDSDKLERLLDAADAPTEV